MTAGDHVMTAYAPQGALNACRCVRGDEASGATRILRAEGLLSFFRHCLLGVRDRKAWRCACGWGV